MSVREEFRSEICRKPLKLHWLSRDIPSERGGYNPCTLCMCRWIPRSTTQGSHDTYSCVTRINDGVPVRPTRSAVIGASSPESGNLYIVLKLPRTRTHTHTYTYLQMRGHAARVCIKICVSARRRAHTVPSNNSLGDCTAPGADVSQKRKLKEENY